MEQASGGGCEVKKRRMHVCERDHDPLARLDTIILMCVYLFRRRSTADFALECDRNGTKLSKYSAKPMHHTNQHQVPTFEVNNCDAELLHGNSNFTPSSI
jgi:hypothetical protein